MKRILTTLAQKWPEYLLEILVLVIGIYGAFMLDNWNENRKNRTEERKIIRNLAIETSKNQEELAIVKSKNEKQFDAGIRVMNLVGDNRESLLQYNLDSILYFVIEGSVFIPSKNTMTELSNAGRIELISDDELKELIYDWDAAYARVNDAFLSVDAKIEDEAVPYLIKNYAMKDVDQYGGLAWSEKSQLTIDKLVIFNDIVFENNIDDLLYRITVYNTTLDSLQGIQSDILSKIADQ